MKEPTEDAADDHDGGERQQQMPEHVGVGGAGAERQTDAAAGPASSRPRCRTAKKAATAVAIIAP